VLLPFTDSLVITTHFDPEMAMLADRHYSRRTIGARQFIAATWKKLVIRNTEGSMLFAWTWGLDEWRKDGQQGYNCAIFRNESLRRSSEIILECEAIAVAKWGPNRMFTYVNPAKIESRNPGYCFKMAGWSNVRVEDGSVRVSKTGQHLLEKLP